MLSAEFVLRSLYYHLVLPPRLPDCEDDWNTQAQLVEELLRRFENAAQELKDYALGQCGNKYYSVVASLLASKAVNVGHAAQQQDLQKAFKDLQPFCPLIIYIVQQNAGLLLWKYPQIPNDLADRCYLDGTGTERSASDEGDYIVFEVFESSPRSEAIFSTDGALRMVFPGSSYAVPFSEFQNPSLQLNLARVVDLACHERLPRFSARTHKADANVIELRDTTNPELITTWLATLLEANGYTTSVSPITKRVKDDVCWTDGARAPWRRMPFYLVLRIGLRRSFQLQYGSKEGMLHYKLIVTKTLSSLSKDLVGKAPWDMLGFIKAKVCRRMAKLEEACSDGRMSPTLQALLESSRCTIWEEVSTMSTSLELAWNSFKQHSQRAIQPLQSQYAPVPSLQQDMPSSRDRLVQLVRSFEREPWTSAPPSFTFESTMTQYDKFTNVYLVLARDESMLRNLAAQQVLESKLACRNICCELSNEILNYVGQIHKRYATFTERLSNALLNLMDLWTTLDQFALAAFPLLRDFKPVFPLDILNVLHVVSWEDMRRLHRIQLHLNSRHVSATLEFTIFQDPTGDCFAEKFFNSSSEMQATLRDIEREAAEQRAAKEEELKILMDKRREMEAERAMHSCLIMTTDKFFPPREYHNRHQCRNCQLQAELKRQRILVHEHPLPRNNSQAKAAVFELCIPKAFALYRDATWSIIKHFGQRQELPSEMNPGTVLSNYPPLKMHWKSNDRFTVGLASLKKSFMLSHWREIPLPATVEDVCLPSGIEPIYFDMRSKFLLRSVSITPTFSRKLGLKIPSTSPFSFISEDDDFAFDHSGPPSNKVISSQSNCPASLSFQEHLSFQALFSGYSRRWCLILMELGSSNMNFSNEACSNLISTLASQVGPPGSDDSVLRIVHKELSETTFCEQMIAQIHNRLQSIQTNWRETHCMSMLVNLILRILVLCPDEVAPKALMLLETARTHLAKWIKALFAELKQSTSLDATRVALKYTLWAALLCRRTFQMYIKSTFLCYSKTTSITPLDESALRTYILATVSLQHSVKELHKTISSELQEAIVQDILLVSSLTPMLSNAFRSHPAAMTDGLHDMGMVSRAQTPKSIRVLPEPHGMWIEVMLTPPVQYARSQILHFHMLAGHILVDNTPQGKLSEHFRNSPVLDELFGKTNLYAVSSGLPGMQYRLTIFPEDNEIHVGKRNGAVVVRIYKQGRLWEILDRQVFHTFGQTLPDLPHSLIYDCLPFLDLQSRVLELRRKAGNSWNFFPSDWRLSMHDWRVTRSTKTRTFTLVNYHGRFYERVLRTFRHFEDYPQIIVYQPSQGPLEVELRRLELKFLVNRHRLFESKKLACEVPVNQDAGCLYGLKSALVIQDVRNPTNRHVLVPFGSPVWKRRGMHLEITIKNDGNYARYTIDPVLGRLSSPAQLRLLHRKALIHALTSFIVPDPLTGRTGTEEAMYTLASGLCQPTFPLEPGHLVDLNILRGLVPRR
jgi:hypothetical protein